MINFKEIARIILLLILAIFYFIIPHDLIPDSLGRIGRVDDVIFLLIIIWFNFFKPLFDELACKTRHKSTANHDQQRAAAPANIAMACEILQVSPEASLHEIKQAYHKLIKQYHPDRVHDLGHEIKALADSKTSQLNEAYEMLCQRFVK